MLRDVVYLGGPYSCRHKNKKKSAHIKELRYRVLTAVSMTMLSRDSVISPITQSHVQVEVMGGMDTSWAFWEETDLALLRKSDRMVAVLMPEWERSIGLMAEIAAAKVLKLNIGYVVIKMLLTPEDKNKYAPNTNPIETTADINGDLRSVAITTENWPLLKGMMLDFELQLNGNKSRSEAIHPDLKQWLIELFDFAQRDV